MTEEKNAPENPPIVVDGLLELLIKFSEPIGGSPPPLAFDITLAANGMLVSGKLIGYREYIDHFANFSEKLKETMLKSIEDDAEKPRNFIHLRDAFFFTPGQRPIPTGVSGVFWRAKLTAITGFNFGRLKND